MGFDRRLTKKGLEVNSIVKEGRAELSFTAYLEEDKKTEISDRNFCADAGTDIYIDSCINSYIEFQVWDKEGQCVITVCRKAEKICQARAMLLYPHLWQAEENPYLYQVTACLIEKEKVRDEIAVSHGIYSFQWIPWKGCLLNGRPFQIKAVSCKEISRGRHRSKKEWIYLLSMVLEIGANTICLEKGSNFAEIFSFDIVSMCETLGLVLAIQDKKEGKGTYLAFYKNFTENQGFIRNLEEKKWIELKGEQEKIPELAGIGKECLMTEDGIQKKDSFFYLKACWSKKPFVYLCECWKNVGKSNVTRIRVFSNQPKVVLYVEHKVFEYRNGGPEFVFEDVPLIKEETVITVQAGNCYASTSILRQ